MYLQAKSGAVVHRILCCGWALSLPPCRCGYWKVNCLEVLAFASGERLRLSLSALLCCADGLIWPRRKECKVLLRLLALAVLTSPTLLRQVSLTYTLAGYGNDPTRLGVRTL